MITVITLANKETLLADMDCLDDDDEEEADDDAEEDSSPNGAGKREAEGDADVEVEDLAVEVGSDKAEDGDARVDDGYSKVEGGDELHTVDDDPLVHVDAEYDHLLGESSILPAVAAIQITSVDAVDEGWAVLA